MTQLQRGATSTADLAERAGHVLRIWCLVGVLVLLAWPFKAVQAYSWDPTPGPQDAWFWNAYFCPSRTPVESCAACLASRLGVTSEVKVDNPSPPEAPTNYSCYSLYWDGVTWLYAGNTVKGPLCPDGTTLNADRVHCDCPEGKKWFDDVAMCVTVTTLTPAVAPPNHPANNGGSCPGDPGGDQPQCGEPINPASGNMWHTERDYAGTAALSDLTIVRTYNSNPYNWDEAAVRGFGKRWTHRYDAFLRPELAYAAGGSPATCWRREDTDFIWCSVTPVVRQPIPDAVSIVRSDGKRSLFRRSQTSWTADANNSDRLSAVYDAGNTAVLEWIFTSARDDATERFDSSGRLLSITARSGATQRLTYSDGQSNDTRNGRLPADAPICTNVPTGDVLPAGTLLCVTSATGRQLQFDYAINKISKVTDPAGQIYLYEYDGPSGGCLVADNDNPACNAQNLTKVTYPDGTSRTYFYNESARIMDGATNPGPWAPVGNGFGNLLNTLTGLVDENGTRYISWTYDHAGRATGSQLANDVNKVSLSYTDYDASGKTITAVTHQTGESGNPALATSRYTSIKVWQRAQNTAIDQPCIECGAAKSRSYDTNGNLFTRTDWNGNKTCFSYDTTRNLETVRLEGTPEATTCGASLAALALPSPQRKTSTRWHATFRLPLQIAEPSLLTTYSYDSRGNLLTRTEQATLDPTGIQAFTATPTGAARTWRYSYNDAGQVLTMRSPRTDLDDTVSYTYDQHGNLVALINAAGHTTALAEHDPHGRPGTVTDPNGITTTLRYTARGWLASHTTGGDTTAYAYDGVGQLTGVTLPDGSSLTYHYDDAHRLSAISDTRGNRLDYTLDLSGNRTGQHTRDPDGVLARQTTRVYDTLNRLQSATGAAQ